LMMPPQKESPLLWFNRCNSKRESNLEQDHEKDPRAKVVFWEWKYKGILMKVSSVKDGCWAGQSSNVCSRKRRG
jgi:hypothetical protein